MRLISGLRLPASVAVFLAFLLPSFAPASVLTVEQFNYPAGNLVGYDTWTAHSAGGSKPIQITATGQARLDQSAGTAEDANKLFEPQSTSAKTFAGFLLTVPTTGPGGGAPNFNSSEYFAHFRTSSNSNFRSRIYVTGIGAGTYTLGMSVTSSGVTPVVNWPAPLTMGEQYHIVVSYDAAAGSAELWVNPATEASPKITSTHATAVGEPVDSYGLRQASGSTSYQLIDNIVIATSFPEAVPVPAASAPAWVALGLALLGAGAFAITRRRASA